ncbi:hypothetical protein DNTS_027946 [Danionella cerebrum]|uniref:Uncharacterized protein n=1 Tax=Danionella cerebrum TaxID=2873325 RepID=A0A553QXC8_9TELE|nr:hypothetical protein DNTS_027946 [Danionella translucida]
MSPSPTSPSINYNQHLPVHSKSFVCDKCNHPSCVCLPPSSTRLASSLGNLYQPQTESSSSPGKPPTPSSIPSQPVRSGYSTQNYHYELNNNNNHHNTSSSNGVKNPTFNLNHTSLSPQGHHRAPPTGLSGISARYLSRSIPVSRLNSQQHTQQQHFNTVTMSLQSEYVQY